MEPIKESPMSNRQKMILAAVKKREQGLRLYTEGDLEFRTLTGEKVSSKGAKTSSGGSDVTKHVSKLAPKKKKVAHKTGRRVRPPRTPLKRKKAIQPETIDRLLTEIPELAKEDGHLTLDKIRKKLTASFYPVTEAVKQLIKEKVLKYEVKEHPTNKIKYKYIVLAS